MWEIVCCLFGVMATLKNKRVFVNKQQKEAMIDYIENNPMLKNPPQLSNKLTKKDYNKKWEDMASQLNEIGKITGGAVKDAHTWKKTWQDLKSNVKKKVAETRRYEMGTGGGPPLPEVDIEYEKIKEILDPVAIEGDNNVLESMVVEIFNEPDTVNADNTVHEVEDEFRLEEHHYSSSVTKPEILKPSVRGTIVPNKCKRLADTLQVSTKISEEIAAKTALKQEYYIEKLKILKENTNIEKEKLKLIRQDIEVKREISTSLQLIVQCLRPSDSVS